MKFDILDYMGKINDGCLVLISLVHEQEYYEGTFYYTKNMLALTVERRLEEKLGCIIEQWPGYRELMLDLIKKVVPLEEIITRIDDIDTEKYLNPPQITYIDPDSTSPTQSNSEEV